MGRINFIQYKNKTILIEDFTNLVPGQEFLDTIAAAQKIITSQPENSVLAVLDATNTHYDTNILNAMKAFVKANSPYIRCSAVVGVTGLLNVAVMTLSSVSGRSFKACKDRQSALDYLARQ